MHRCRNRKSGIQSNKETGAIGCILSRRFLLLFVFPVPDKDTAKKTVDKYKVGVCFLNGTLEREGRETASRGLSPFRGVAAVAGGGKAAALFEQVGEVVGILEAGAEGDFLDRQAGAPQQVLSGKHPLLH